MNHFATFIEIVYLHYLYRSTSSVTDRRPKTRPPIAKPVRRSKSQHISAYKGGSFVTSIQHGGSVTLVSLGGENSAGGAQRADQVGFSSWRKSRIFISYK